MNQAAGISPGKKTTILLRTRGMHNINPHVTFKSERCRADEIHQGLRVMKQGISRRKYMNIKEIGKYDYR
jgi:hypothetical protein